MRQSETQVRYACWLLAGWLSIIGLAGCSVLSRGSGVDLSSELTQTPSFDLAAGARMLPSGQAELRVQMSVPTALTRIRSASGGTAARVRWTVEVLARPSGEQLHEVSWVEIAPDPDSAKVGEPWVSRVFNVPAGDFLVAVTAEDEGTGVLSTSRRDVQVPNRDGSVAILDARLEASRSDRGWVPQISRSLTVNRDSLRVRAQVVNAAGETARVWVERLVADSSVAEPPFATNRQPASLTVVGVRVRADVEDTTFVQAATIEDELAEIVMPLPSLGTGSYRIRIDVGEIRSDRFLVIRRVGFPAVERIGDLVAAMQYITTESEQRALTARSDPFLQRRAFDRFWGDRIPDRRLAAATVRALAERVEEANAQFSNQKAGWKTDRGMAYVLFGPPQRIEPTFRAVRWIYTSGPVSGLALEFERTPGLPDDWPYEVWVLRRGPAYDVAWQRGRRAWRRGDVP